MEAIPAAVIVTIAIFMAGVIFHAGQITARVSRLEEWRRDEIAQLDRIFEHIRRLEALIRSGREE